jgi:hypothetical protein
MKEGGGSPYPRGDNCYLISGFLTCDDVDDYYYYHHHHHHLIVVNGNILKLNIMLLFFVK